MFVGGNQTTRTNDQFKFSEDEPPTLLMPDTHIYTRTMHSLRNGVTSLQCFNRASLALVMSTTPKLPTAALLLTRTQSVKGALSNMPNRNSCSFWVRVGMGGALGERLGEAVHDNNMDVKWQSVCACVNVTIAGVLAHEGVTRTHLHLYKLK